MAAYREDENKLQSLVLTGLSWEWGISPAPEIMSALTDCTDVHCLSYQRSCSLLKWWDTSLLWSWSILCKGRSGSLKWGIWFIEMRLEKNRNCTSVGATCLWPPRDAKELNKHAQPCSSGAVHPATTPSTRLFSLGLAGNCPCLRPRWAGGMDARICKSGHHSWKLPSTGVPWAPGTHTGGKFILEIVFFDKKVIGRHNNFLLENPLKINPRQQCNLFGYFNKMVNGIALE